MKRIDESFGTRESNTHAAADCVTIAHCQIDFGNAGPVVCEGHTYSLAVGMSHDLQAHDTAAAVYDGVAGQFARGRDDAREIAHREAKLARPNGDAASGGYDIDAGAELEAGLFRDDRRRAHARAAAARSTNA